MISTFLFVVAMEISVPLTWFVDSNMKSPRAEVIVDESR